MVLTKEEFQAKEKILDQESSALIDIQANANIEKDNLKPPTVKISNNSSKKGSDRKSKLNRIAHRIKVNFSNPIESRNYESNQDESFNNANQNDLKSYHDSSMLRSVDVVENDSFEDMSDHSLERVKKALNILKTFKLSGDLIKILTEDEFPNKTPQVYKRLWKEVEDRKIRDVALKYSILMQNKKEIHKILRPQSELTKEDEGILDDDYKSCEFRTKNYSVIGTKLKGK